MSQCCSYSKILAGLAVFASHVFFNFYTVLSSSYPAVSNWFGDTSGNTSWGHLDFISLEDLYKSSNGYIVSDSLIVDVEFINMSQTRVFSETRAKTKIKTELI